MPAVRSTKICSMPTTAVVDNCRQLYVSDVADSGQRTGGIYEASPVKVAIA